MSELRVIGAKRSTHSACNKLIVVVLVVCLTVFFAVILAVLVFNLVGLVRSHRGSSGDGSGGGGATIPRGFTTTPRSTVAGALPRQIDPCGRAGSEPWSNNSGRNATRRQRERIVNGQSAAANAWPWVVSIRVVHKAKLSSHLCGGSLIYDTVVLTAAHCIYGYGAEQLVVVAGVHTFDGARIDASAVHYVVDFFYHPDFDTKRIVNDIAVLKLAKPVRRSANVSTICLPQTSDASVLFNKNVIAAGWGSTSGKNKEKDLAQTLQQTILRIRNGAGLCGETDNNYCAVGVDVNSNTCYGDSGSPLMHFVDNRWYIYGLTSFILSENSTCITTLPSFYTIVPNYLSWIGNVLATLKVD